MSNPRPTPETDAAGVEELTNLQTLVQHLIDALKRIAEYEDAPDIDATGEWQTGLHCGVEDRDCRDRYEGADYGHTVGVEKGLEWAVNEAKHALESLPQHAAAVRSRNQTLVPWSPPPVDPYASFANYPDYEETKPPSRAF